MKLQIPFFKQTTPLNCGPVVLRMVLAYLGEDPGLEVIEKRTEIKEGKGISTIQIATVAASLGYRTEFYSKHATFNEENLKLDYYKQYSDMDLEQAKRGIDDAAKAGVNIHEKTLSSKELLSFVTEASVPIVLIDWNIIKNRKEKGYQGHFVPIVGYDAENVFIHNPGLTDPQEFMPVKKELFEESRKAEGTDEDIIIIHKK